MSASGDSGGPMKVPLPRLFVVVWTSLTLMSMVVGVSPVSAATPGNDDRASATVVDAIPFRDHLDTSGATPEADDPDCASGETNPTVWYTFTPATTGRYIASTTRSEFYATLLLARVTDGGELVVLACQDWGWNRIVWKARAGTTYLLMAGAAYGEPGGLLRFRIKPAPKPPWFDLTLADRARVTRNGKIELHGRVTCRNVSQVLMLVKVRQDYGRHIIRGSRERMVTCGSTWQVQVGNHEFRYAAGEARVSIEAGACNGGGCAERSLTRTIRVR